jgi:N-acetylglucosamine kinase-like BadF-type ATPase
MRTLSVSNPRELPAWISRASKKEVGDLAPLVLTQARQGDAVSRTILERACQHLTRHLDAALVRWGPGRDEVPVALAGGLMTDGSLLRDEVTSTLRHRGTVPLSREIVPARGAARLALVLLKMGGVP